MAIPFAVKVAVVVGFCIVVTGAAMVLNGLTQTKIQAQAGASLTGTNTVAQPIDTGFTISKDPHEFYYLDGICEAEATNARIQGRKPFVKFYGTDSESCDLLHKALEQSDPQMVDAFAGTYIIRLDGGIWNEDRPGVWTVMLYARDPVFCELTAEGKPTSRYLRLGEANAKTPAIMAQLLKKFFRGELAGSVAPDPGSIQQGLEPTRTEPLDLDIDRLE